MEYLRSYACDINNKTGKEKIMEEKQIIQKTETKEGKLQRYEAYLKAAKQLKVTEAEGGKEPCVMMSLRK